MDFGYLESIAAGDRGVVAEVLALYCEQAALWQARLAAPDDAGLGDDWRDVVHTIKGASRGIGAAVLGDVCERVEQGGPQGLAELLAALEVVLSAIANYSASTRSV